MLSEEIRRNPHIVDQQTQHKWADKVAKLECVARAAKEVKENCETGAAEWNSPGSVEVVIALGDLWEALKEVEHLL